MNQPVKVSVQGLYKIFGETPESMLESVYQGMSKADLMAEHNHVLGLNDINVDMREGEITVIMGLSGSGKSTLIRHLNRLIEPTAGKILLDGEDILQFDAEHILDVRRRRMSMVFQKFALFPHRTVAENAALAMDVRGEPTKHNIKRPKNGSTAWGLRVLATPTRISYPAGCNNASASPVRSVRTVR